MSATNAARLASIRSVLLRAIEGCELERRLEAWTTHAACTRYRR